jgi:hypothetical protein
MALSLDGTTGISATGNIISSGGIISATGNIYGGNIIGTLAPSAITVSGNATVGNLLTGGVVSATGNIQGGNLRTAGIVSATGNITGSYILGNGSQLTGVDATQIVNGTSNAKVVSSGGNIAVGIGGTSNVAVFATTGAYVTGLISATGNITGANLIINGSAAAGSGVLIVSGNIQTSTSNATSNIGNASNYFNRLFAQATTALYADLAEVYKADAQYPPGTVLVFGGTQEVTMSTVSHDNKIAGVVSTHPAHVMNSGLQSEFTVEVGLIGRVPCRVIGPISAGDRVVSSNRAGVAERLDMSQYQPGVIIGKALESYSSTDVGTIEVVVGRL